MDDPQAPIPEGHRGVPTDKETDFRAISALHNPLCGEARNAAICRCVVVYGNTFELLMHHTSAHSTSAPNQQWNNLISLKIFLIKNSSSQGQNLALIGFIMPNLLTRRVCPASNQRGGNLKLFKVFNLKARPESGLGCLMCAIFARQRPGNLTIDLTIRLSLAKTCEDIERAIRICTSKIDGLCLRSPLVLTVTESSLLTTYWPNPLHHRDD